LQDFILTTDRRRSTYSAENEVVTTKKIPTTAINVPVPVKSGSISKEPVSQAYHQDPRSFSPPTSDKEAPIKNAVTEERSTSPKSSENSISPSKNRFAGGSFSNSPAAKLLPIPNFNSTASTPSDGPKIETSSTIAELEPMPKEPSAQYLLNLDKLSTASPHQTIPQRKKSLTLHSSNPSPSRVWLPRNKSETTLSSSVPSDSSAHTLNMTTGSSTNVTNTTLNQESPTGNEMIQKLFQQIQSYQPQIGAYPQTTSYGNGMNYANGSSLPMPLDPSPPLDHFTTHLKNILNIH